MLELKKITKVYKTGAFEQKALNEVSVNFRKSEFVSVLGPSGSGKTTMLNIVGGLDQYTSGDLIINGVSTKKYKDSDWDTYRNHRVGFVFQSYNLIPHQSVLANVELALTLSGIGKKERRKRAIDVLKKVGLEDHIYKKPNELSGGQMQRVAIARALINDPDILLADEPTGALDTETSSQIMALLKEISEDKLVVMVTHNSDLAYEYSTRIITVLDGKIISDSGEFDGKETKEDESVSKEKSKKTSMSFLTALSLSLNNLMTKKGRTILTAFAGSIGIIGIALILSLSTGVQNYINRVQADTLSSYPLTISNATADMSTMMSIGMTSNSDVTHGSDKVYSNNIMTNMIKDMTSGISTNNLKDFKVYLETNKSEIAEYVNDIKYSYGVNLTMYKSDTSKGAVQVSPVTVFDSLGMSNTSEMGGATMSFGDSAVWNEMSDNKDLLNLQYDVVAGKLPTNYNEVVMILDKNNEINDYALYGIGLKDQQELAKMLMNSISGGEFVTEHTDYTYEEILNLTFKLVLNTDYYTKSGNVWISHKQDPTFMKNLVNKGEEIKVVGVVKPKKDANIAETTGGMGYTSSLTNHLIEKINASLIVKEQLSNPNINVFTGTEFSGLSTFELNKLSLGIASLDDPSAINIYPKDFDSKDEIENFIKKYNKEKEDKGLDQDVINYTDYVGLLMSSVTTIVNIIGYVLIAFVSISLVVSSIMIGIITYISVLERTKEIGILRAIGASKKDISRVFNAETFIIGLFAGLLGIGITILLNIPINILIKNLTDISNITALPTEGAIILVLISMVLTIIAGLIPSHMASKKDPVVALRTE